MEKQRGAAALCWGCIIHTGVEVGGLGGVFGLIEVCVTAWQGNNKGLCVNLKSQREGIGPRPAHGAAGELSSFQCIHAFGLGVQRRGGTGKKIGGQKGIFQQDGGVGGGHAVGQ